MEKKLLWIGLAVTLVSGIILFNVNNIVKKDTIYEGVSIDGIDMSDKNKEETLKILQDKKEADLKDQKMTIKGSEKSYDIKLNDIGIEYAYEDAVDEAYSLGRNGNLFRKLIDIASIKKNKEEVKLKFTYDRKKIEEKIINIAEEVDLQAMDSEISIEEGKVIASEEKDGYKVKQEKLLSQIEKNIDRLEAIEIPLEVVKAKYKKEYYSKINGVIGESSTSFNSSGPGRVKNIEISARAFNGKLVHPGEILSYNSTIGTINSQAGYQNAPVIVNGDLVPGMGGGVCQTSTTLYNALLRADLTVTERSHHSIPSSYMDKGLDAVVVENHLDLKFRNDFDYPVYISSWVAGKTVYFKVYGDKENRDYTIQMQPKITNVIPHRVKEVFKSNIAAGSRQVAQQGRNGYKVITYKNKVKDGKVIESQQISSDYYRERDTVYHVGPKIKVPEKPTLEAKPDSKPDSKPEIKPEEDKKEVAEVPKS